MSKTILIINGTSRQPKEHGLCTLGAGWAVSQWVTERVQKAAAERGLKDVKVENVEPYTHFQLPTLVAEMPAIRKGKNVPISEPQVQAWSDLVEKSSAILFVSPNYNSLPSHTLLIAINHLNTEWHNKPAGVIGYGPGGGVKALEIFKNYLFPITKVDAVEPQASIKYAREDNWYNKITPEHVEEAIGSEHADVDKVVSALLDKLA